MADNEKLNLVFFGPPGVGKSTIGRVFSDTFGLNFYEGDEEMTLEERKLVSSGQWGDPQRLALLERTITRMNHMYANSESGLVTSLALTKQWMREFLSERSDIFLQFVLVVTLIEQAKMEELIAERHRQGHPISVDAFRRFTLAFETPTMDHHVLVNPHQPDKQKDLLEQMHELFSKLR